MLLGCFPGWWGCARSAGPWAGHVRGRLACLRGTAGLEPGPAGRLHGRQHRLALAACQCRAGARGGAGGQAAKAAAACSQSAHLACRHAVAGCVHGAAAPAARAALPCAFLQGPNTTWLTRVHTPICNFLPSLRPALAVAGLTCPGSFGGGGGGGAPVARVPGNHHQRIQDQRLCSSSCQQPFGTV